MYGTHQGCSLYLESKERIDSILYLILMKEPNIDTVLTILADAVKEFDVPVVDLINIQTNDPFKVLVTTILSARTNDRTTAAAAGRVFGEISTMDDLRTIDQHKLEQLIYPVGFYKNKAKHLKLLPEVVSEEYGGTIPETVDELVNLPGVGRKTANLVVAVAFEKPAICVDTHVHTIMNRLGYIRTSTPFETEMALRKKLPEQYWLTVNRVLVAFGQQICRPVSPFCSKCPVSDECQRRGVTHSR